VASVTPRGHIGWRSEICTRGLVAPNDALYLFELFSIMALRTGVDPAAFRSTGGCSAVELPKHICLRLPYIGGQGRTPNWRRAEESNPTPCERPRVFKTRRRPFDGTLHMVADLGTAPSLPAYETGVVSSRPPRTIATSFDLGARSRTLGRSIFAGASPLAPIGFVDCAAVAAARINWLARREGVEPSPASFGDSPDPAIPTYSWCDRRDSNPHCHAGNAAVCHTTSDRMMLPRSDSNAHLCA
jgi:hypothetical protein